MSLPGISPHDLLDTHPVPALLVTTSGVVKYANRAARSFAGSRLDGVDLCALDGSQLLATFLNRCSGTGGTLVGAVELPQAAGGTRRLRCHGSRLPSSTPPLIALRCAADDEDRFSLLTSQLQALNDEVRRHRRTQEILKESLRERELLLREVHHRVKNNIQILYGMLSASARESASEETRRQLEDAARRLGAMAAVQHALYHSDRPATSRADTFLEALVTDLRKTWTDTIDIDFSADPMELSDELTSALALIVNELLTNSMKYASRPGLPTQVTLRLNLRDGQAALFVKDSGPGFQPQEAGRRSSGLGLVRGLTRQLRGRLHIEPGPGARCEILFPYHPPHRSQG